MFDAKVVRGMFEELGYNAVLIKIKKKVDGRRN